MLNTLGLISVAFIGILWTLPTFLLRLIRVRLFKITTNRDVISVTRQVANYSTVLVNGTTPAGFFCGRWFCGYVHEIISHQGNSRTEVYLLCTKAKYSSLVDQPKSGETVRGIKLWERSGNFFHIKYTTRVLNLRGRDSNPSQLDVIAQVKEVFDAKEHAVAYIHGEPGAGKSMAALLLAREMKAALCKTFNPTEPGDSIADLYAQAAPTKETPLVIVLDEVDVILRKLADGIPTVKYIPVAVKDKTTWNSFLDDIDLGLYPWLIVVMTSNKSPEWVEKELDPSYIRPGRVDLRAHLK